MAEYDRLLDYEQFYRARLDKMTSNGKSAKALCPFHDDKNPSLSIDLETGLWKCHACEKKGNALAFLQEHEGLSGQEAHQQLRTLAGLVDEKKPRKKYTVEDYAETKKLPVDFLRELGLKNAKTGITIPYYDESGAVLSNRSRYGDSGSGPRFSWARGSKVHLYGLWTLPQIRQKGYVVLVEGESDCHTLWWHEYPALGVPGSSVFQTHWSEYLDNLEVYVFQEPDTAGETFTRKVAEALGRHGRQGSINKIELIGSKDPSELHINHPESFAEHFDAAMEQAEPLDIMETAGQVEQTIPDAPVQLRQPPNWRFHTEGVFTVNEKTGLPVCVSRVPIVITRRLNSIETGEEKAEIAFRRDSQWHREVVKRSSLFHSQSLINLADRGMTVTSENAKSLVKFLGALESENIDLIEKARCVSQLGWHGSQFVPGANDDLVIDVDPQTRTWLEAYTPGGSFGEWKAMVEPCRKNPIFRFVLASGFAAPLLRLTDHRIFIVHHWGDTRIGKTACLKAGLSVWGDPEGLMTSFYATRVGLERLAGFFRDLPLGVDERQVSSQFGDNLMYMLTLGMSKVRGAKTGGLQSSLAWRTIILTTGEEPLTQDASFSGLYSRVLEFYGPPFANESEAQKFHDMPHYGYAGPEFVRKVAQELDIAEFRALYQEILNLLTEEYPDKVGSHLSAISLVAATDKYISEWIFGMESDYAKGYAIDMALKMPKYTVEQDDADVIERCAEYIMDWLMANEEQFLEMGKGEKFGFVEETKEERRWYIFPRKFQQVVQEGGFPPKAVRKGLVEKGYVVSAGNRDTVQVRYPTGTDSPKRFVLFRRKKGV